MGSALDSDIRAGTRYLTWPWALTLAAFIACASSAPLQSPAKGGIPWRELTSEHFSLFTDAEPADARHELQQFERLRTALEQVAFPSTTAAEPRVSIVLFSRRADYDALGPSGTNGFASAHLRLDIERQPTVVIAGDARASAQRRFVHEEVHELMDRAFGTTPIWLNEGLADYFSSLRLDGDLVVLGDVVPERTGVAVGFIPSATEIVRASRSSFRPAESGALTAARYCAGAWLLVHLLRDGPEVYRTRFNALADALNSGHSAREAWHIAMTGIEPSRLEADFRAHMNALSWPRFGERIRWPPPSAITERVMRPVDVHLLWARVAQPLHEGQSLALREIEEAAGLEPDSPEVAYARGCAALAVGSKEAAATAFEAALTRAPREPRYLMAAALATGDCGSSPIAPKNTGLCYSLVGTARSPEQNALAAAFLLTTPHQDDALWRAQEALHADGRCAPCALVLAEIFAAHGDTPGAIAILEKSVSVSAETPQDRWLAKNLEKYRLLGGPPSPSAQRPVLPSCTGECTERADQPLVAALRARAAQTKSCYDQALGDNRALGGKARVLVRVAEDGSVCTARMVTSDMPSAMDTCVLQIFRSSGYPPSVGGCHDLTIPLAFTPDDTASNRR